MEATFKSITWDVEANNLLNDVTVDYASSPYKLKDTFDLHCVVVEDHETGQIVAFYDGCFLPLDGRRYDDEDSHGNVMLLENYEPVDYIHFPLDYFPVWVKDKNPERVVAHNGINYDHLVVKLYYGMDYTVYPDSWCGFETEIVDTLVQSKAQNPDRFGGHSLDKLSEKTGVRKIHFRSDWKDDHRFETFGADMLYYCIRDCKSNTSVDKWLQQEAGDWDWADAINLEKAVAEIITRQSHRGFNFDKPLAERNVQELDVLMAERAEKVKPVLPRKPATKTFMKNFMPPVLQFKKKSGEPSANMLKFAAKLGAEVVGEVFDYKFVWQGKTYDMPLPMEPLVTEQEASIDDTTHIKDWLIRDYGWEPSEYKDRDLTVNSKKEKLSKEKYVEAVNRYVDQTLKSAFCKHRCAHLQTTPQRLRQKLLSRPIERSVKVLTNPNFTKGQEKELCPDLERLTEKFPYAKDVVEYHTYRHRRNSILGGGLDWEEGEEAEKGYIANVREDGRIATPADTCGAATARFKHKVVANIPRPSSLYGAPVRSLFGVSEGFVQIGYDFDSLEARIEGHYCWRYDEEKGYCNSLLMAKPNDVHTKMAEKISELIGKEFGRTPAKATKYASTYGATAPKIAQTIGVDLKTGELVFTAFWDAAAPLKRLKEKLTVYWEKIGGKKFVLGIDGRKIPTRSPHAILNSLFQSAGVICAKRAMVLHDRKLKAEGFSVDFFKDDWKSMKFCQQLIAYHDECQLEVNKELVQFKTFTCKKEAEKWKEHIEAERSVILSDVMEVNDEKFFVGYCRPGELAIQSVKEAGEYYGLNVELTAGYMLGKHWAACH